MFPKETRILIVDDMVGVRQLIKTQLAAMGYDQFTEAENGEIAFANLQVAKEAGTPIGLVISDWNMPEVSGIEFLQRVRSSPDFKELPFLLVTAEGELKQVIKAIQLGVSDYILKPFTPEVLWKKISAVWAKHHPAKA